MLKKNKEGLLFKLQDEDDDEVENFMKKFFEKKSLIEDSYDEKANSSR